MPPSGSTCCPTCLLLQVCSELGISTVGELAAVPLPRLESAFGKKDAQWLFAVARGVTGGWVSSLVSG